MKRAISIVLAMVMLLSGSPAALGAEAKQDNPPGITIPDGFSLQYIGRYHEASPVINGMIAVSNGEFQPSANYRKPIWGFVNAVTGQEVIAPQYTHGGYEELTGYLTQFAKYPHYYGNVVVLRDWNSATVLNKQGKTVVPYGKYRYISVFLNGYAEVETYDGKWGIINEEGQEMFPPGKYKTWLGEIDNWGPSGIIPVERTDNGLTTAINVFGKELITPSDNISLEWPREGLLQVWDLTTGQGYVIDRTGKKLFTYQSEKLLGNFSEGLCYFYQFKPNRRGDWSNYLYSGFIDTTGKEVFKLPQNLIMDILAPPQYQNGLTMIAVQDPKNPYWARTEYLLDKTGKEVFKTYGVIGSVGNGLAQVFMPVVIPGEEYYDSVETLYNIKTGKSILPEGYRLAGELEKKLGLEIGVDYQTGLEPIDDLIAIIENKENGKMAYLNANGKIVVPPGKYQRVEPFTYGKGRVQDYTGKWGFIDSQGHEIIKPQFDVVTYFVEDKAVVGIFTGERVQNAGTDYLSQSKPAHDFMTDWYILTDETYTPPVKSKNATALSSEKAEPTTSTVLVDGKPVTFEAYTISGYNYFKLRDLAQAVSHSEKSFAVTWDAGRNAINLISHTPYTPVGGELSKGDGKAKTAILSTAKIYKDGQQIYLTAYTINGNSYFKLRDMAEAFDLGVAWDDATNTVVIDTTKRYGAE